MSQENEFQFLVHQVREHLKYAGVRGLPADWVNTPGVDTQRPERSSAGDSGAFQALHQKALSCTQCRLADTRTNVVFGVGNSKQPLICFVGEGPGADEDRQGEPFVGRAGALLTAAITKGLGLRREDVYIANVVKCRPPKNRTPLPDEIASCMPFLERQLELIQPKVIVTLGGPAQSALTGVEGGITKLRGNWLEWRNTPLMPTFHPAYILRNPAAKRPFWEDLQEVMKHLGMKPKEGS